MAIAGLALLVRPVGFLGIRTRTGAGALFAAGLALSTVALLVPPQARRIEEPSTRLDEFSPVFEFSERHSVRIDAPQVLVWDAVKTVTAGEISFFRELTWIRRLGRPGSESVLNAPAHLPILEVATRTSFLLLAEEPGREIVIGTVVLAPPGTTFGGERTPARFRSLEAPGLAKATMSFLVENRGGETSVLTTETRVHATDPSAQRRFAVYWRVIYPGSALIRRMWLRAIRLRAEASGV